ncbi:MAG: dihydropteroate synthase [Salinarchaeum sp.]
METVTIDGLPIGDGYPPRIMSVLNMSEQSGYGPSVYLAPEEAARFVDEELVPAGADIVDVGLQSANPKYEAKPVEKELDRLEEVAPILDHIEADVPISLETRYAEVAEAAIGHGFDIINDVCGFADPDMKPTLEAHDMPVVKMASPPDLARPGALKTVDDLFEAIQRDGFTDRTIIDPAFGGWYDERTFEDNYELFRRLREFRAFGRPILTATNREDFLGALADKLTTADQLPVSLAAATMEVERGAHVIRTHDTDATADVVKVAHALGDRRVADPDPPAVVELPGTTVGEAARQAALGTVRTHSPQAALTRAFVVGDLTDTDVATLLETDPEAAVVERDDGLYIVGTIPQLDALATAIDGASDRLSVVAERLRQATAREC